MDGSYHRSPMPLLGPVGLDGEVDDEDYFWCADPEADLIARGYASRWNVPQRVPVGRASEAGAARPVGAD